SEVFLRTLSELIRLGHVRVDGWIGEAGQMLRDLESKPLVGRLRGEGGALLMRQGEGRFEISTSLALAQVNACLRQQGRAALQVTERTLLGQLREDGKLLDPNGEPVAPNAEVTRRVRLDGQQVHVFTVSRETLFGA